MKPAIIDGKCRLVGHFNCRQCRTDEVWRASAGTPEACPHNYAADRLPLGLGDVVEKVTRALGIRPCGGCRKRKKAMNVVRLR